MEETDITTCMKKRKKAKKISKKIIVRLENILHTDKMPFKIVIAKTFFVCSFINF